MHRACGWKPKRRSIVTGQLRLLWAKVRPQLNVTANGAMSLRNVLGTFVALHLRSGLSCRE